MRLTSAYLIGLVFGTGIALSGMANSAKVLNFFDLAGTWDPSLAFVMGGALAVAAAGYRLVLGQRGPLLAPRFQLPAARSIDARLLFGSAIFGIGWGPPASARAVRCRPSGPARPTSSSSLRPLSWAFLSRGRSVG